MNNKTKFAIISGGLILADQISKYLIREKLNNTIKINSFFSLEFIKNTGAGFGILKGQQIFLILISLIVIGGIIFYLKEIFKNNKLTISMSLIFAGGLGNLIDRIFLGYVTDFLSLSIWPAFNIADSAISLGAILLLIHVFQEKKGEK